MKGIGYTRIAASLAEMLTDEMDPAPDNQPVAFLLGLTVGVIFGGQYPKQHREFFDLIVADTPTEILDRAARTLALAPEVEAAIMLAGNNEALARAAIRSLRDLDPLRSTGES